MPLIFYHFMNWNLVGLYFFDREKGVSCAVTSTSPIPTKVSTPLLPRSSSGLKQKYIVEFWKSCADKYQITTNLVPHKEGFPHVRLRSTKHDPKVLLKRGYFFHIPPERILVNLIFISRPGMSAKIKISKFSTNFYCIRRS